MGDKRKQIATTIRVLGIKKTDLAEMVANGQIYKFKPCQISDYLRGRPLSEEKAARLEKIVEDVERVWTTLGIRTDLSDLEGFTKLLAHIKHCETEQLVTETARFARQASQGLEASCSLTEQKDI
jgi:hypothetical protein